MKARYRIARKHRQCDAQCHFEVSNSKISSRLPKLARNQLEEKDSEKSMGIRSVIKIQVRHLYVVWKFVLRVALWKTNNKGGLIPRVILSFATNFEFCTQLAQVVSKRVWVSDLCNRPKCRRLLAIWKCIMHVNSLVPRANTNFVINVHKWW